MAKYEKIGSQLVGRGSLNYSFDGLEQVGTGYYVLMHCLWCGKGYGSERKGVRVDNLLKSNVRRCGCAEDIARHGPLNDMVKLEWNKKFAAELTRLIGETPRPDLAKTPTMQQAFARIDSGDRSFDSALYEVARQEARNEVRRLYQALIDYLVNAAKVTTT